MATSTTFSGEQAPCGRVVDGHRLRDDDEDGFVIDHLFYDCGCSKTVHKFHDGSVRVRALGHHGKVLVDEHSSDHEA